MNLNLNKIYYFKIFVFISWIGLIASINSSFYDLESLNFSFINIINFLRYLSPIIIF